MTTATAVQIRIARGPRLTWEPGTIVAVRHCLSLMGAPLTEYDVVTAAGETWNRCASFNVRRAR